MELYIVFTDTKTVLSRAVKAYSRHSYGHVSLSFDRSLTEMYSFGRKDVNNAFAGGFIREDIRNKLFQRAHFAIYKCRLSAVDYRKVCDYVHRMKRDESKLKYNVTGLFGVVMKKEIQRDNSFFCSQFVAEALAHGGVHISGKSTGLVMPSDIFRLPELEYVYSGRLGDYTYMQKTEPCRGKENKEVMAGSFAQMILPF